jgi:hypothetical protein
MSHVETLSVFWPVGAALSCWLFFEMATRISRAGQSLATCRIVAKSISPKHGALSDARVR